MPDINRLHTWIFVGTHAYDEYTFIPWLQTTAYRRTVDLKHVVWC